MRVDDRNKAGKTMLDILEERINYKSPLETNIGEIDKVGSQEDRDKFYRQLVFAKKIQSPTTQRRKVAA